MPGSGAVFNVWRGEFKMLMFDREVDRMARYKLTPDKHVQEKNIVVIK
jgi:hypothetical protein